MSATLWDSFEDLLQKAENHFLDFQLEQALQTWDKYYQITAKVEYKTIINEVSQNWDAHLYQEIDSLSRLYIIFTELEAKKNENKISQYTFNLFKRLIIRIYQEHFAGRDSGDLNLESGVFEYLSGNLQAAREKLETIVTADTENIQARMYLGFTYLDNHQQKEAVSVLTENLFLAADKLPEEALYLSQYKLLFGKLYSDCGNREEAAWLLVFESWYRNYLVFTENNRLFRVIQHKESNERIIQVKYYTHERYRHFVRCLYLADYTRHFHKEQRGLIHEQENYMQKLDRELFARYRKKRQEI